MSGSLPSSMPLPKPRQLDFAPFRTSYLFLLTGVVAIVTWTVALVGQAVWAKQVGFKVVGILWFAILLQAVLTVGFILTIATDSVATNRLQMSVFGGIAVVYAVTGVQAGIFSASIAAQAMSAGWLILTIVDIIWVLYFTSEEDSLLLNLFNLLGSSGLSPTSQRRRRGIHSMANAQFPHPIHAVYTRNPNYALGAGVGSHDMNNDAKTSESVGSVSTLNADRRSITSRSSLVSAPAHPTSPTFPTVPSPTVAPPSSTVAPSPTVIASPTPATAALAMVRKSALQLVSQDAPPPFVSPSESSPVTLKPNRLAEAPTAPPTTALPDPPSNIANIPEASPWKAKALHGYTASPEDPTEMSFKKGDILDIEDRQGKWWEAKRADGTVGIVPSNYLQII
ncbi:hypothetical protein C8J57DRAFT_478908 [Mycena rebaudengoi]|nr:hypothetical protein C8J57DRAFT_478908 [Mycena rebaudengoi]